MPNRRTPRRRRAAIVSRVERAARGEGIEELQRPARRAALEAARDGAGEVLDERLLAYKEDVDLGWRIRRAGYRIVYEPAARALDSLRGLAPRHAEAQMAAAHLHLRHLRPFPLGEDTRTGYPRRGVPARAPGATKGV